MRKPRATASTNEVIRAASPEGQALLKRSGSRSHKYRAQPVVIDGVRFDSSGEAARWHELKLLERTGAIQHLQRQVRIALHAPIVGSEGRCLGLVEIGALVPDFVYWEGDRRVVEDFKSPATKTAIWRWKVKHLLAEYAVRVRETHR